MVTAGSNGGRWKEGCPVRCGIPRKNTKEGEPTMAYLPHDEGNTPDKQNQGANTRLFSSIKMEDQKKVLYF